MAESTDMTVPSGGISQAQLILADAGNLIQDEAQSSGDKKRSKGRSRDILGKLNRVIGPLEAMAQLHPAATATVKIFKALLKLETDRRENSEQIVILFHSMASMLFVLRYLDRLVLGEQHELSHQLSDILNETAVTMERFGDLADLYYNKCKQPVVRFLRSGDFKSRIQFFFNQFAKHRNDLQHILVLRMESRSIEHSYELDQIRQNTERIIARLGEPANEEEVQAFRIVTECGREKALHDKAILEQVSTLIGGGRVTGNTQQLLDTSLDDLLNQNMEAFHRKLENSMTQVSDAILKTREAILKKLDSGPHELIDDPDIKQVWQGNAWKLSVKCRQFVDEITNHYEEKFRNEAATLDGGTPKDHWTLAVLSKVMHHPAIGDAIDEDGSGFISLYETKDFLSQCPNGWSTPEWLVYWAIGWQMNNIKYNSSIIDTLDDITSMCRKLIEADTAAAVGPAISQYLDKVTLLRSVTSWANGIHADSNTQDLSNEGEARLRELLEQASKDETDVITGRMEVLKWLLDDPADFPVLLGGTDVRIELMFMSILNLLMSKHHDQIRGPPPLTDGDWDVMSETLHMLIVYFHERMQDLLRGWRAQKLNVELNISCFAGGIYNGWYVAYNNPNGEVKRLLEKNPNKPGNDYLDPAQINVKLLGQVGQLTQRVDQLDARLDTVVAMLQALLTANSIPATSVWPPSNSPTPALLQTPIPSLPHAPTPQQNGHTAAAPQKPSIPTDLMVKVAKKVVSHIADSEEESEEDYGSTSHVTTGVTVNVNATDDAQQEDPDDDLDLYYTSEPARPRYTGLINAALLTQPTTGSDSSEGESSLKSPDQPSSAQLHYGVDAIINQPMSRIPSGPQGIDTNFQQRAGAAVLNGVVSTMKSDQSYMEGMYQFPSIPTPALPDLSSTLPDLSSWQPHIPNKDIIKGFRMVTEAMSHGDGNRDDKAEPSSLRKVRSRLASIASRKSIDKNRSASDTHQAHNEARRKGMAFTDAMEFGYDHMNRSGPPMSSDEGPSGYPFSAPLNRSFGFPSPSLQGSDMEGSDQGGGGGSGFMHKLRKMASSKSLSKDLARRRAPSGPRSPQNSSPTGTLQNSFNQVWHQ